MSINGTINSFGKNEILRFKFCISKEMVDHNNMKLNQDKCHLEIGNKLEIIW